MNTHLQQLPLISMGRSVVTTMDSLPPELLAEIFVHCALNDPLAPIILLQVTHLWNQIVEHSPTVWQSIVLTDSRPLPLSWLQADRFLKRSHPLTFDVRLDLEYMDYLLPLLAPLLPYINRWSSFTLQGAQDEYLVMPPSILGPERLDIALVGPQPSITSHAQPLKTSPFLKHGEKFIMKNQVITLPKPSMFPTHLHFTQIHMQESSLGIRTAPEEILHFLTACPQLEDFSYRGLKQYDGPPKFAPPIVQLPRLRKLEIGSTCSVRLFLSSIHAPSLDSLYLVDINVDFSLNNSSYTEGGDNEYNEEGDSEDEAEDFSQSASSDHATGMGLRALISRSQPPLRVLEMHYADMRTKDFKYLFSRLRHLEEFSISASDMSNSVLSSLAPFQPVSHTPSSLQVRLPKLRRFELHNCENISGAKLAQAVTRRVHFQNSKPVGSIAQFTDVAIVECGGVTGFDQNQLRQVLRNCSLRLE